MKRKWLYICLLGACGILSGHAEERVTFYLNNGDKVSFAFSEHPMVALNKNELTISTQGKRNVVYAYETVKKIVFENDISTDISIVASNSKAQVLFSVSQEQIKASGLQAGERLYLYALSGALQQVAIAASDGTITLSLGSLPNGVYIVRTQNGLSYKFFKQ